MSSRYQRERITANSSDILGERLRAGEFEGTLPELSRWINHNRAVPSNTLMVSTEIRDDLPSAKLVIPRASTVEEVLLQFATETGTGWVFVENGATTRSKLGIGDNTTTGLQWFGGYLMPISDFGGRAAQRRIAALMNPAAEVPTEPAAATNPPASEPSPEPEASAAEPANPDG